MIVLPFLACVSVKQQSDQFTGSLSPEQHGKPGKDGGRPSKITARPDQPYNRISSPSQGVLQELYLS